MVVGGRTEFRADLPAFLYIVALAAFTGGCQSTHNAATIASQAEFRPIEVPAEPFTLQGYFRPSAGGTTLRIYIEGDGKSWRTRTQVSDDPTPKDPLALRLAIADPDADTVLYLARPCQFIQNSACRPDAWTAGRFSSAVIESFERALDFAAQRFKAKQIVLIGYSGGGVVATLVAAKRANVSSVITVAAPLDHAAWTSLHGVSPLVASLNPIDFERELHSVKQFHYVGSNDTIVPPGIVYGYLQEIGDPPGARVITIDEFTHRCCWPREWPRLINDLLE